MKFNPDNPHELASNGVLRVLFLNWQEGASQFQYYSPKIEKKDFHEKKKAMAAFTKTVFIPNQEMAVTGTSNGQIVVWARSFMIEGIGEQNEKRLNKIVVLNGMGAQINILTTVHDKFLVCGNTGGTIQFYDFQFKIHAWFDDLHFTTIKSISFSKKKPDAQRGGKYNAIDQDNQGDEVFSCSDFLVSDESGLICSL